MSEQIQVNVTVVNDDEDDFSSVTGEAMELAALRHEPADPTSRSAWRLAVEDRWRSLWRGGAISIDLRNDESEPCIEVRVLLPDPANFVQSAQAVRTQALGLNIDDSHHARFLGITDDSDAYSRWGWTYDAGWTEMMQYSHSLTEVQHRLAQMRTARVKRGYRAGQALRHLITMCEITDRRARRERMLKRYLSVEGPEDAPL